MTDEASFLTFVAELLEDRRLAAHLEKRDPKSTQRGWQNSSIEDFLESALAWAKDSDFGRRQDLDGATSPWRQVAAFLYAGKIYE